MEKLITGMILGALLMGLVGMAIPSASGQGNPALYVGCSTVTPYPMNSIFLTATEQSRRQTATPGYNASTALAEVRASVTPVIRQPTLAPSPTWEEARAPENLYIVVWQGGVNYRTCAGLNCAVGGGYSYGDTVRIETIQIVDNYEWGKIVGLERWVALRRIGGVTLLQKKG
jgi:hypothetical protein